MSINQLAEHAVAAVGSPGGGRAIVHAPARPGEQRSVQANIDLARSILGWEPRTRFETGLAKTVLWSRDEFASHSMATAAAGGAQ